MNNKNYILDYYTKELYDKWKKTFTESIENIESAIESYCQKYEYLKIADKLIYIPSKKILIPNLHTSEPDFVNIYHHFPEDKKTQSLNGKSADIPNRSEAEWIINRFWDTFVSYSSTNNTGIVYYNDGYYALCDKNGLGGYGFNSTSRKNVYIVPVIRIKKNLPLCIEENVDFSFLGKEQASIVKILKVLCENKIIQLNDDKYIFAENTYDAFYDLIKSGKIPLEESIMAIDMTDLLKYDNMRCGLTPYDENILTDSNRGHWELWDSDDCEGTVKAINNGDKIIYARNPACDINSNSLVAIDFGTKSTVAVILDEESRFRPIRIGSGDLSSKSSNQYENPTVIQFIDFNSFIEKYLKQGGRPLTKFNEVAVSHNAYDALNSTANSGYKNFVSRIKQYAGERYGMRKSDDKNADIIIKPYSELQENDIDIVEIYAYYIGLYINNMYRKIFLNYSLSMPVNYDDDIRERIKKSFEKGFKKSLPDALLNNKKVMEKFSITASSNESASYAVTALTEFGFEPDEDEKYFYGIFDFGGGTTDFDFGFWRGANRSERRYDYVITYYDDEGDKTLGGENILDIIAYTVWSDNIEEMRKKNIPINVPADCNIIPDCELLICSDNKSGVRLPSDESSFNSWKLSESLRWIWEEQSPPDDAVQDKNTANESESSDTSENYNTIHSYKFNPDLYDITGKSINDLEITVNVDKLRSIIRKRIEKGVFNFFECLRKNANRYISEEEDNDFKVNIFLAGNSCRSSVVEELFNEYISKELEKISDKQDKSNYFKLFYPLGTEKAKKQISERCEVKEDGEISPDCKTGVAYGLLLTRNGGKIKVVDKRKAKTRFDYYIGYEKRKKFVYLTDKNISFDKWYELIDASEDTFELYYTSYPEAVNNNMPINETKKAVCSIDVTDADANIYYRPVSSSEIEYVVAKKCNEGTIVEDDMLTEPVRTTLE